jgi:hypothetical protein
VARETHLNWKTIKALEMQYMREQLRRAGPTRPRVIGLDECRSAVRFARRYVQEIRRELYEAPGELRRLASTLLPVGCAALA